MLQRLHFENCEEWLKGRKSFSVTGSDASAACGLSKWKSNEALWKEKTGAAEPKDISGDAFVKFGVAAEPVLRSLFGVLHPEQTIEYHAFDILFQEERPWLGATLDGELIDTDGRRGILEIKTSTPTGKNGWNEWSDGKIPTQYYCQILCQMLATGYDYAFLFALLRSNDENGSFRTYRFDRDECTADLAWLYERLTQFNASVEEKKRPDLILPSI